MQKKKGWPERSTNFGGREIRGTQKNERGKGGKIAFESLTGAGQRQLSRAWAKKRRKGVPIKRKEKRRGLFKNRKKAGKRVQEKKEEGHLHPSGR